MKRSLTVITLKLLLLTFCNSCYAQHSIASVYFKLGATTLSLNSKKQLDSLAYHNVLISSKHYNIVGYADNIGTEEQNSDLSETRAKNIAEYLHTLGINNIQTIIGEGEIDRPENAEGYPEDRRVDIVLQTSPSLKKHAEVVSHQTKGVWEIYFQGRTLLTNKGKETLSSLINHLKKHPNSAVMISGFYCGENETVLTAGDRSKYIKWRLDNTRELKYIARGNVAYGNPNKFRDEKFKCSKRVVVELLSDK